MYKWNPKTTEAIIKLIKTLPKEEQAKIAKSLTGKKSQKPASKLTNKE
jgi:hypothetical protein